jgi:nucleotide-binding universal stress UspA family protein
MGEEIGTRAEFRVVVGVSQSPAGLQALRYAIGEARHRDAELYAVRAFGFQPPWAGYDVVLVRDQLRAEAGDCVREAFEAALGGPPPDLRVVLLVRDARADAALIETATEPGDLLVLGGRTSGRRTGWLVRTCVRHAACPVVVVPPPLLARAVDRRSVRRLLREIARQSSGSFPQRSS